MTAILFCNIDGSERRPTETLARGLRSLRRICREFGDPSRPWMVAVSRRPHLLKFAGRIDDFARFVTRPTPEKYRLEKHWGRTRIGPDDVVTFTYLPGNGGGGGGGNSGGKSGLSIGASIAAIALAVIAPYAIPFIAGGLGAAAGTVAYAAVAVAYTGVVVGLNYLAARAGQPKANKDTPARPLYGVSGGGNQPRPGDRIPVGYGRYWTVPALSQPDYVINVGEQLTLYKRMTIGCGRYALKTLRAGTAILWDAISGVPANLANALQVELIEPGAASTLVPATVTSSADVGGIELPRPDSITPWAGPFRASPAGVPIRRIQLDYSSGGLYANGPTGSRFANTAYATEADVWFEYAPADGDGNPVLPWVRVSGTLLSGAVRQAVRRSTFVEVAEGEYLVRARNNTFTLVWGGENAVSWDGLRGYVGDVATRPGVTELAITIKAGPGLQITSFSNIEAEVQRILPCRRAGAFTIQESRKALDAFVDMARDTDYGLAWPDSRIDYGKIEAYIAGLSAFDTFDGQINGPVSGWEALGTLLGPMRAEPALASGILSFVRDEPQDVVKTRFTRREIVSETSAEGFKLDLADSAAYLRSEYLVGGDPKRRQEAFAGYGPEPIARKLVNFEGVTGHDHATHLTRWGAASAAYRRMTRRFDLETSYKLIYVGATIGVDNWFFDSALAAGVVSAAGDALTIDCDLVWEGDPPAPLYCSIVDTTGREFGPMLCGVSGRTITLNAADRAAIEAASGKTLAAALGSDIDTVPASLVIGPLVTVTNRWIVRSIKPKGWNRASVECVNDAPEVWAAIGVAIPAGPSLPSQQTDPAVPALAWVRGAVSQDGAALRLSWSCDRARGARSYEVEYSAAGLDSWERISLGAASEGVKSVSELDAASFDLRARATGDAGLPGPWVYGSTPSRIVEVQVALGDLVEDARALLQNYSDQIDAVRARINALALNVADLTAGREIKILDLTEEVGAASASITQTAALLADAQQSLAQLTTSVAARFGAVTAAIVGVQTAYAAADAALASDVTTLNTRLGTAEADIATNATGLSTLNGSFSAYTVTVASFFTAVNANVAAAQATADGAAAVAATASAAASTASSTAATASAAAAALDTSVKARFGEASGQGGIYMTAAATGGGSAEAEIKIAARATNAASYVESGLSIIVNTAGASRIKLDAQKIVLADSARALAIPLTLIEYPPSSGVTALEIPNLIVNTVHIRQDAINERFVQSGSSTSGANATTAGGTNTVTVFTQAITATAADQEIAVFGELLMTIGATAATAGSTMTLQLVRTISGSDLIIDSRTYVSAGSAAQVVNYGLSRLDFLANGVTATYSLRVFLVGVSPSGIVMTYSTRKLVVLRRKR